MAIPRGATPTHNITTTIDLSDADVIYITYAQRGRIVFEKTKKNCTFGDKLLSLTLTQEETLRLNDKFDVDIQIRARFVDGKAYKSNIMNTSVERLLKEGVI